MFRIVCVNRTAVLERVVESHGAVVQTADGVASGVSPEDKLLRTMIDAVSEFERALIRARTKAALAAKKSKGQRVGGIPYGYRLANDGTRVVRDAHEQNTIRRLKRLRRTRSLRELAVYCDEHGIRARHSVWSAVTLSRLFRREAARTSG